MRLLPHGMKIGHATVIVDIVPKGNPEIRPGIPMKARGITDHDTGNKGRGADAIAHNKLLHNWGKLPVRDTTHVSWHGAIDEDYIIQHLPFDEPGFHCGDGWGLNSGNRNTIGFEKCMHEGANRTKIEENAIALYAFLMKEMDFPINWIRPHQYWSGKYCPALILNKYGSFLPFRNKIEAAFKSGAAGKPSKPQSIVDYLNAQGQDSSITARAKLAAAYGIKGYVGSEEQNIKLLGFLVVGKPATKPVVKPAEKPKEVKVVVNPIKKTDPNEPSDLAKEHWEEMKANGYLDGTRPHDAMTRQEYAVANNRLRKNLLELINDEEARKARFEKPKK
ncbi:N-acetylmuramoyl-L-alanine amidase [Planococcus halotolerans]|uniref:N-acetylmuramoyl-L-alanine amidase n=1 Tax=Planococcus halotolerans TaxID=2233542 RepID=A0A365KKH2_9BACL|nr:N-acetylmuramoyl-L-alanine amidase [Planococcus halotolerans]RAZ73639.1 hypothetical protein DP120_17035 [Planococcus halotolerans]